MIGLLVNRIQRWSEQGYRTHLSANDRPEGSRSGRRARRPMRHRYLWSGPCALLTDHSFVLLAR